VENRVLASPPTGRTLKANRYQLKNRYGVDATRWGLSPPQNPLTAHRRDRTARIDKTVAERL